jgi:hypothetical protein
MENTTKNGDCLFECFQKLLFITHDVELSISNIRQKISDTVKLFTSLEPPLLDSTSLINEISGISTVNQYISLINDNSWGGEPEIIACSSLYNKIIIIKTLKLNIPDRTYYPSIQLPNRNVQPGLWIIYHVNTEDSSNLGNHYQYKGKFSDGILIGSISDISTLENILELLNNINEPIQSSMSILSNEGIQYAGNPNSLQALNKQGLIKTKTNVEENLSNEISIPQEDLGIQKPNEEKFVSSLQSKTTESTDIQSQIKNFLYN